MKNVMRILIVFYFAFLAGFIWASEEQKVYVNQIFAQIHQNPSRFSVVITTFECNHPLKLLVSKEGEKWIKVGYGNYEGHIQKEFVDFRKSETCFQRRYPKFFDGLSLGVAEMHNWGRLLDVYIMGHTLPSGIKP